MQMHLLVAYFRMRGATHVAKYRGNGESLLKMQEQTAKRVFMLVCWRRVKNRLALIKCTAMGAVEENENTRARDSHPPPPPPCASAAKC